MCSVLLGCCLGFLWLLGCFVVAKVFCEVGMFRGCSLWLLVLLGCFVVARVFFVVVSVARVSCGC